MSANTSTGPVTEFITLKLRGGLSEGHDQLFFKYPPVPAPRSASWGLQHEDPKNLHWAISTPWNSLADQSVFNASSIYEAFSREMLSWCAGSEDVTVILAEIRPGNPPVGTAPVTEWCTITLAEGATRDGFAKNFEEFEKGLKGEGYVWHSSGWIIQGPADYMLIIGWDSVKAHQDWRASEVGEAAIAHLKKGGVSGIKMIHVNHGGQLQ